MDQPGYTAQIFVPNDEDASIESVNQRLIACLQSQKPNRIGKNENIPTTCDSFTGYWNNWAITVTLETESHVAEESQELAEDNAFKPPYDRIGKCQRRVELWTDEDPNMDYFNTYIGVLGAFEKHFMDAILMGQEGPM